MPYLSDRDCIHQIRLRKQRNIRINIREWSFDDIYLYLNVPDCSFLIETRCPDMD
jgi:hypothetical protein